MIALVHLQVSCFLGCYLNAFDGLSLIFLKNFGFGGGLPPFKENLAVPELFGSGYSPPKLALLSES